MKRKGEVNLVEVLVIISIIAIVTALLIPAIQQARYLAKGTQFDQIFNLTTENGTRIHVLNLEEKEITLWQNEVNVVLADLLVVDCDQFGQAKYLAEYFGFKIKPHKEYLKLGLAGAP